MRKKEEGKISEKQQRILDFIAAFIAERGYPPSVREIGQAVGLRSPSTVHTHLKILRDAGFLERTEHKTRALALTAPTAAPTLPKIPILRKITAGTPVLAEENIEGYLPYECGDDGFYALRMRGRSMTGAGILDGDLMIVRQNQQADPGQIVIVMLGGEAACRRLSLQDGKTWLMPENPDYSPIDGSGCVLLGVVTAVHREYAS